MYNKILTTDFESRYYSKYTFHAISAAADREKEEPERYGITRLTYIFIFPLVCVEISLCNGTSFVYDNSELEALRRFEFSKNTAFSVSL